MLQNNIEVYFCYPEADSKKTIALCVALQS